MKVAPASPPRNLTSGASARMSILEAGREGISKEAADNLTSMKK
jgi:hypothetical protein